MMMTKTIIFTLLIILSASFGLEAQNTNASKKAKVLLAEASSKDLSFPMSEAKIREAKAIDQSNSDISYNFGNLYIKNNEFDSARLRLIESIESTDNKSLKHKSYHNLGNILMEEEQYQMAVDAYKDALRNEPTDEETRYNLAYAKSKLQDEKNDDNQDGDDNQDENQDKNEDESDDESKDNKDDGENEDKDKDNKDKDQEDDKGDKDESEEDQKDDDGNKDKQEKEGEGGEDEQKQPQQPQNQKGQISPEQIQRLLEAIENQEKDIQEKLNAEKAKGQKSKTGKDW